MPAAIAKLEIPTTSLLDNLDSRLRKQWIDYLEKVGVEYPSTSMQLADLLALYSRLQLPVHKSDIASWTDTAWRIGWADGKHAPSKDRQCRHLRSHGWSVVGSGAKASDEDRRLPDGSLVPPGCYALTSVTSAAPSFIRATRLKRSGKLVPRYWQDLCDSYDNRCARCQKRVRLEKGHMDPDIPAELSNMIPLCAACNNESSDNWVLNRNGFPVKCRKQSLLIACPQP